MKYTPDDLIRHTEKICVLCWNSNLYKFQKNSVVCSQDMNYQSCYEWSKIPFHAKWLAHINTTRMSILHYTWYYISVTNKKTRFQPWPHQRPYHTGIIKMSHVLVFQVISICKTIHEKGFYHVTLFQVLYRCGKGPMMLVAWLLSWYKIFHCWVDLHLHSLNSCCNKRQLQLIICMMRVLFSTC